VSGLLGVLSTLQAARSVAPEFAIEGELGGIEPLERGHIHETFVSAWRQGAGTRRYLHQRLNTKVFGDVPGLMRNIERVTRHIAHKLERERGGVSQPRTLTLVPTRTGAVFLADERGAWRTYEFIEGTRTFDSASGPEQAHEAARCFGAFQAALIDLDPGVLHETIPDFFSSPHRLRQFHAALRADAHGRAAGCRDEIRFVEARAGAFGVFAEHERAGRIPPRVVHGDTKLNNVLFDEQGRAAVCIVDLDTCMRGWSLYDFGDLARFTAATSREDERDLSRAGIEPELYRALRAGYLAAAGSFLTGLERELLPDAAHLVTLTVGTRFLTDFLAGDVYFKTHRPGHNLDRARVQLAMVAEMERRGRELRAR
jgi:Ser/Thr protein kinase RdoA (MazF antagonist)